MYIFLRHKVKFKGFFKKKCIANILELYLIKCNILNLRKPHKAPKYF